MSMCIKRLMRVRLKSLFLGISLTHSASTTATSLKKARIKRNELELSFKESEVMMRDRHGDKVVDAWKKTPLNPVKVGKECKTPFRLMTKGVYLHIYGNLFLHFTFHRLNSGICSS